MEILIMLAILFGLLTEIAEQQAHLLREQRRRVVVEKDGHAGTPDSDGFRQF